MPAPAFRRAVFSAMAGLALAGGTAVLAPAAATATTPLALVSPSSAPNTDTNLYVQVYPATGTGPTYTSPAAELDGNSSTGTAGQSYAGASPTKNADGSWTFTFDLMPGGDPAGPGAYTLRLCNLLACSSGGLSEEDGAFTVGGASPAATSLSPGTRASNAPDVSFTLDGSGFARGATVSFSNPLPAPAGSLSAPTVSGLAVSGNGDVLTGTLHTASTAVSTPTTFDLRVVNTDGGSGILSKALTVDPAPTITGFSYGFGQGATNWPVQVTGTGFASGATAAVSCPGCSTAPTNPQTNGVSVNSLAVSSPTAAVLHFTASSAATPTGSTGPSRVVTITNPDGGSAQASNPVDAAPTVSAMTPSARGQNSGPPATTVTVTGTNFSEDGTSSAPTVTMPSGVHAGTVTYSNAGTLTLSSLTVDPTAQTGTQAVTVQNPDGGIGSGNVFTVDAAPAIRSVSPATAAANTSNFVLTVNGSGFAASGATVSVTPHGSTTAGTTQAATGSSTSLSTTLPSTGAVGLYDVTVTNPDGGVSPTACSCFNVDSFTFTAPSPNTGTNAETAKSLSVTVTGTPDTSAPYTLTLTPNPPIAGQGPITSVPAAFNGNTWTGAVDLGGTNPAAAGTYSATLSNGVASGSCSACFTVVQSALPTVSAVAPSAVAQGTAETLTLTGTGFTAGDTVTFPNDADISTTGPASYVAGSSGTHLQVPVAVSPTATVQTAGVAVSPPGGGGGTPCGNCLAVDLAPRVTGLSAQDASAAPVDVAQGAHAFQVTVTGTGLQSGGVYSFPSAPVNGNVNDITAAHATGPVSGTNGQTQVLSVTVALGTPVGTYDMTVTNPDNGTVTVSGAVHVEAAPTATSVTPDVLNSNAGRTAFSVQGTGFYSGTPAPSVASSALTVSNPGTVAADGSSVSVSAAAASGVSDGHSYDVTVTDGDGGTAVCTGCLLVADPPSQVTGLAATTATGGGALDISWTAAQAHGTPVTGYIVSLTPPHGATDSGQSANVGGSATSTSFSGLVDGEQYTVSVTPQSAAGAGQPATTTGTPYTVPGAPSGVAATPGNAQATVGWTAPADDGGNPVSAYQVAATGGGQTISRTVGCSGACPTSATVTGLTNGTSYTVTVAAVNQAGAGPAASAAGPVVPYTVPGAPSGVTAARSGSNGANVSWTAPSSNGRPVTAYRVRVSTGAVYAVSGSATSYLVAGLPDGGTYTFTVAAQNAAGWGPYSQPSGAVVIPANVSIVSALTTGAVPEYRFSNASSFTSAGGHLADPAAVAVDPATGTGYLLGRGTNNVLYSYTRATGWKQAAPSSVVCQAPDAVVFGGQLVVACRATNGHLLVGKWTLRSGAYPYFSTFTDETGYTTAGPAVGVWNGRLVYVVVGNVYDAQNGYDVYSRYDGSTWQHGALPGLTVQLACSRHPALAASNGTFYAACISSRTGALTVVRGTASGWAVHTLSSSYAGGPPSLAVRADGSAATLYAEGTDQRMYAATVGAALGTPAVVGAGPFTGGSRAAQVSG